MRANFPSHIYGRTFGRQFPIVYFQANFRPALFCVILTMFFTKGFFFYLVIVKLEFL